MSVSTAPAVRRAPPWMARALPFACYMFFLAVASSQGHLLPDPRWMYGLQITAVLVVLTVCARGYDELWRLPQLDAKQSIIAIALGSLIFLLWISLDFAPLTVGSSSGFDPRNAAGDIDWRLATVRVIGAALVVPVMEELFWRSLVMRRLDGERFLALDPRTCSLTALLSSSVVFGLEHTQWFAGILAGLAYGWLYRQSGSLWSSIIAHSTTNLLLAIWVLATGGWHFW